MYQRILPPRHASALFVTLIAFVAWPTDGRASAWLVDDDELTLGLTYDFQHAESEFLPNGTHQEFPLNGTYSGSQLTFETRYGISEKFELAGKVAFKHVSYQTDPVILEPEEFASGAAANDAIFAFSESALGAGNVRLAGRYQLLDLDGILVMSSDTELKLPTGYDEPEATFKDDTTPSPDQIRDDVALGDGQTDITQTLQTRSVRPGDRNVQSTRRRRAASVWLSRPSGCRRVQARPVFG